MADDLVIEAPRSDRPLLSGRPPATPIIPTVAWPVMRRKLTEDRCGAAWTGWLVSVLVSLQQLTCRVTG